MFRGVTRLRYYRQVVRRLKLRREALEGGGEMLVLTREREARRWSKNELARRARMSGGDVGKIELGRLKPYDGQLAKLARALGWPIDNALQLLEVVETAESVTAK
jgi:hypothetical protein